MHFRQKSGIHCIAGCSLCCQKADIEATPLEFGPFAYEIWKSGKADEWMKILKNQAHLPNSAFLKQMITHNESGFCSNYQYHGLICRLFAYAARRNKYNMPEYIGCYSIKME